MATSTVDETERMVITRVFDAPRELVWKAWTRAIRAGSSSDTSVWKEAMRAVPQPVSYMPK